MLKRTMIATLALAALMTAAPASANHASGFYEQPVWFQWGQADLDVLIIPPNHGQLRNGNGALNGGDPNELNPLANSYLRAIEDSIADWDRGIAEYGSATLTAGLTTNVYVVGRDTIPQDALENPEIVVFTDETKGSVLGVAVSTRPCLVDNSKLFTSSFTYEDMFNINSQEYGHCMGLSHVNGDARGTKAKGYTDGDEHDPMNGLYPETPGTAGTHRHCVSNLNIAGVEEVFRRTLTSVPGANMAKVAIADYVRPATC